MLVTHPRVRRTGLSNGQVCTQIGWRHDLGRSTGGLWTVARSSWRDRRVPSFSAPAMSPPTHSPDACAGAPFLRFPSRDPDGDPESDRDLERSPRMTPQSGRSGDRGKDRAAGRSAQMLTTTFWISGSEITDRSCRWARPSQCLREVSRWPASRRRMLVTHCGSGAPASPMARCAPKSVGASTSGDPRVACGRWHGAGAGSSGSELQRTSDVATDAQP